jgi:hypothetical protein
MTSLAISWARSSNFLRGTIGQLILLGAATLVLLFFAWTYLD